MTDMLRPSQPSDESAPPSLRALIKADVAVWAALLGLLALTFALAHIPLGVFNAVAAMVISALKTLLVLTVFMALRRSPTLMVLAAVAGVFWLALLFTLTFADLMSR